MKCLEYCKECYFLTSQGRRLCLEMNFSESCYLVNHFICVSAPGPDEQSLVLSDISRDSNQVLMNIILTDPWATRSCPVTLLPDKLV